MSRLGVVNFGNILRVILLVAKNFEGALINHKEIDGLTAMATVDGLTFRKLWPNLAGWLAG